MASEPKEIGIFQFDDTPVDDNCPLANNDDEENEETNSSEHNQTRRTFSINGTTIGSTPPLTIPPIGSPLRAAGTPKETKVEFSLPPPRLSKN